MAEETTTLKVSVKGKETFDRFKVDRGLSQAEAFDALVQIMAEREFSTVHPSHAATLEAIDTLFAKVRAAVEGTIVASEEAVAKVQAESDRRVDAYKAKADEIAMQLADFKQLAAEHADMVEQLETTRELLVQNRARVSELEAEREAVMEREAEAEAAVMASVQAEKSRLEAEMAVEKCRAELAEGRSAAELAARELAHVEERALSLEGDLDRMRIERDSARDELASLRAEMAGLKGQVALLQNLLKSADARELLLAIPEVSGRANIADDPTKTFQGRA